jgi:cobalamin biosynthesis protein CobD/CbiB
MMVDVDSPPEAAFLCALLNSSPARLAVAAYVVEVQTGTHVLENVAFPKFVRRDRTHQRLVGLAEAARAAAAGANQVELKRVEEEVDRLAAKLWGLSDGELAEIKHSLKDM